MVVWSKHSKQADTCSTGNYIETENLNLVYFTGAHKTRGSNLHLCQETVPTLCLSSQM